MQTNTSPQLPEGTIPSSVSEIEKILSLAEEVSRDVDHISTELTRTSFIGFAFVGSAAAVSFAVIPLVGQIQSFTDRMIYVSVIGILAIILISVILSIIIRNIRKRKELNVERRILEDLVETASSLAEIGHKGQSYVDLKLLDLRIKRLSLSARARV